MTAADKEKIIRLYSAAQLSEDLIAMEMGFSRNVISRFLISQDLKYAGKAPKRVTGRVRRRQRTITVTLERVA